MSKISLAGQIKRPIKPQSLRQSIKQSTQQPIKRSTKQSRKQESIQSLAKRKPFDQSSPSREEVVIVGGGPSLKQFNFEKLNEFDTIVTNQAFCFLENPTYFLTVDYTFLRQVHRPLFDELDATKVFVLNNALPEIIDYNGIIRDVRNNVLYDLSMYDLIIKSRRADGLGWTMGDFRTGINSGYAAFQLAVILGYKRIHLIGIDLCIIDREKHFHNLYKHDILTQAKLETYFEYFKVGIELAKQAGISISCGSSQSRLAELIPVIAL